MPKVIKKHAALNKKSTSSSNPLRDAKGKGGMRSKSTIMRLNMYKGGKPIRNKEGKIIGGFLMSDHQAGGVDIGAVARIAPDRRWFGNTRTIGQSELDNFREEMVVKEADPYSVILRRKKIPMALLEESKTIARTNLLETESFDSVFGGKAKRKRPKMSAATDYESLLANAKVASTHYEEMDKDSNIEKSLTEDIMAKKEDVFAKGQSKRIWGELYKVLDCSDVVLQIVDARNVPGTRSHHIENHIKKNASHKHLIIVLNKCDLVPAWVTRKWVKIISKDFPCLAFHASLTNAFGKGALISLLRQFSKLHADKRQISVGVVGYPNTGKSSVINSLCGKKATKVAPIPGETKIWQYITLMKRIFLIDCPGVVYDVGDDEVATVLKGVIRSERLTNPCDFIDAILDRVKEEHIKKMYNVEKWTDSADFLQQLALATGRLGKGGEPNVNEVAVKMINDWQRGKLPYFVPPPDTREDGGEGEASDHDDDEQFEEEEGEDNEEDSDDEDGDDVDDDGFGGSGDDDSEEEEEEEVKEKETKKKAGTSKSKPNVAAPKTHTPAPGRAPKQQKNVSKAVTKEAPAPVSKAVTKAAPVVPVPVAGRTKKTPAAEAAPVPAAAPKVVAVKAAPKKVAAAPKVVVAAPKVVAAAEAAVIAAAAPKAPKAPKIAAKAAPKAAAKVATKAAAKVPVPVPEPAAAAASSRSSRSSKKAKTAGGDWGDV